MKWFKNNKSKTIKAKTIKKCNIEVLAINNQMAKYPNVNCAFIQNGFLRIDDDDNNCRYLIKVEQIRGINIENFTVEVNK